MNEQQHNEKTSEKDQAKEADDLSVEENTMAENTDNPTTEEDVPTEQSVEQLNNSPTVILKQKDEIPSTQNEECPQTGNTETTSEQTCWICYQSTNTSEVDNRVNQMISPCKCKGTMEHVHEKCLLEWLSQSDTEKCPHCHHKYIIDTTYDSTICEWLDKPQLPYIAAGIIIGLMFYGFHCLFQWLIQRKWKKHGTAISSSSMLYSPEMMGMLRSTLPTFHPAFSLFMNGFRGTQQNNSRWNLTLLLAEAEMFCFAVALVFYLSGCLYRTYKKYTTTDDERTTTSDTSTEEVDDVHEGLYVDSYNHNDPSETSDNHSELPRFLNDEEPTIWDVANTFWQNTNIGGSNTSSEEALYLFPFDVLQTTMYTLHYYFKKTQDSFIHKKTTIVTPCSMVA